MNNIVGILRQSAHTHNEWPTQDVAELFTSAADEITRLRAEIAALKGEREWRPIETAPVGKFLLLHWPRWSHFAVIGMKRPHPITMAFQWVAAEALSDDGVQPTRWMPLPAPPEAGND